jgi:hypothetical protein
LTEQELKQLKKIIFVTAEFYGKSLIPEVIQMYASDLKDLDFQKVELAYEKYRKDPRHKFSPMPAEIRQIVHPELTPENVAIDIADRVWRAIQRFGYTNPADAEDFIGPVGWKVVGPDWISLCQHTDFGDRGVFIAQVRKSIGAKLEAIAVEEDDRRTLQMSNVKQIGKKDGSTPGSSSES